jgi:putative peptidoglycan lipid II flippase
MGLIIQLELANRYGVDVVVDAYLFAISLPTFIAGLISSIMTYKIIPGVIKLQLNEKLQKIFIINIINGTTKLSIILGVAALVLMFYYIYHINTNIINYKNINLLIILGCILGVLQIIFSCLFSILNVRKKYEYAAVLNLIPYLIIIVFLFTFGKIIGVFSILLGAIIGTLISIIISCNKLEVKISKINLVFNKDYYKLIYNAPMTILAMSCFSSYVIIDAYWAPLSGEGILASLGYAQRIILACGNLAVVGPLAISTNHFSQLVMEEKYLEYRRFLIKTILTVGGISIFIALIIFLYSELIVEILFQRGEFGKQETLMVSQALRYLSPGMVAMLISNIALRAVYSFEGIDKLTAFLGAFWSIGYFILSGKLYYLGLTGFAISYSIMWSIFLVLILTLNYIKIQKHLFDYN